MSMSKFANMQDYVDSLKEQDKLQPKNKPEVEIESAYFSNIPGTTDKRLNGYTVDHYKPDLAGKFIYTSLVMKHEGDIVETLNTRYKVVSWDGHSNN